MGQKCRVGFWPAELVYQNANPLVRPQNMSDGVGVKGVSGVEDVDESKQLEEEADVVPESSETDH